MKKFNIIILILWMIVIFLFSQDPGTSSSNKSDTIATIIVDVVSKITGNDYTDSVLSNKIENCVFIVRKSAHFLEYLILGILVINVLKDYKELSIKMWLISILFCILYSISDEVHQLFIPGREGRIFDVLIDTSGSIIGITICYLINKFKSRK